MHKERPKSGVITFKSQREINAERQQKLQEEYNKFKKEVEKLLEKNRRIINSENDYLDMLNEEESQKVFEFKQEINNIYKAAKERYIAEGNK